MKKVSLWKKLTAVIKISIRFSCLHSSILKAMEYTYTNSHIEDGPRYETLLQFIPHGSLYEVVLTDCMGSMALNRQTWLAYYSWHAGTLVEIGGERYCIFNERQGIVYIEELRDSGASTISLYTQKSKP